MACLEDVHDLISMAVGTVSICVLGLDGCVGVRFHVFEVNACFVMVCCIGYAFRFTEGDQCS